MPLNPRPIRSIMDARRLNFAGLSEEIFIATGYRIDQALLQVFGKKEKEECDDSCLFPTTRDLDALHEYARLVVCPEIDPLYLAPNESSGIRLPDCSEYETSPIGVLLERKKGKQFIKDAE